MQASDGGETALLDWYKVTVNVTDIEEPGKVTWMVDPDGPGGGLTAGVVPQPLLQFRARATLTATVTDLDGGVSGETWKWYRSSSDSGPWEEILQATSDSYTVSDAGGRRRPQQLPARGGEL